MDDRILEFSQTELVAAVTQKVIAAFEAAPRDEFVGAIPIIGGEYNLRDPSAQADAMKQVIQALLAERVFEEKVALEWHPLPLRSDYCEGLIASSNLKRKLRGYYGRSLRWTGWNQIHPPFGVFGQAVMAAPRCEATAPLQDDRELRMIFSPPRALAGFNPHLMSWQLT